MNNKNPEGSPSNGTQATNIFNVNANRVQGSPTNATWISTDEKLAGGDNNSTKKKKITMKAAIIVSKNQLDVLLWRKPTWSKTAMQT